MADLTSADLSFRLSRSRSAALPTPRCQPYLYPDHEIRKLLKAARTRPSIDPLRPWTYYCLFGLLAVTGLRLGDALNLPQYHSNRMSLVWDHPGGAYQFWGC